MGLSQRQVGAIDGAYRERIVKAVIERGRSVADLANQLKISSSAIYRWIEEYRAANNKINNKKVDGVVEGDTSNEPEVNSVIEMKIPRKGIGYNERRKLHKEIVKKCHSAHNEKTIEEFAKSENIPSQTLYTWVGKYKKELGLEFPRVGYKQRQKLMATNDGETEVTSNNWVGLGMAPGLSAIYDTKEPASKDKDEVNSKSVQRRDELMGRANDCDINRIECVGSSEWIKDKNGLESKTKTDKQTEASVIVDVIYMDAKGSKSSWEEELKLKLMEAENKILREMMNLITKGGK